ncbi:hypothetical protein [Saccharibacillus endophyticus]|uniref:Uncharacterized protein n=1 Tax=Saccharibacillus endophyticus TaxID=2060666 RepID=A0ABQ1ZNS7_9BACL|nr:hypothetical protein [Saccharibacillus endophyticus]GGH71634.1 hypothetical protein GCM10007362_08940 [Saccharibacillus endophyticus]
MKKGKKIMIVFGSLVIVLALGGLLIAYFQLKNSTSVLSTEEVAVMQVSLNDDSLSIQGSISASAISYRDYSYALKEDKVYIDIKGGLVTKKNPSGDFNITIKNKDFKNAKMVYIKDDNNEKLIYPK